MRLSVGTGRYCPPALAVLLSLPGCGGTETGNPSIDATLSLNAHSSAPGQVSLRLEQADRVVDQVWLSLDSVGLVPTHSDENGECLPADSSSSYTSASIGTGDHSAPDALPVPIPTKEGVYCGASVRFTPSGAAIPNSPSELVGHSVLLVGHLADGTQWSLASDYADAVPVVSTDDTFVVTEESNSFMLGFDVARWVGEVDFANLTLSPDGAFHINREANAEALAVFDAAFADGIELYRDADQDGAPDVGATPLARGRPRTE